MADAASPYRPGTGLEPPYLGDRQRQLEDFRRFVQHPQNPRNVLVTGLRGVGKTVLLNHYTTLAEMARWAVIEREFSDADSEPSLFARTVLSDLAALTRRLSLPARLGAAAAELAEGVQDFIGSVSIGYGEVRVSLDPRRPAPPPRRLDDDLREALVRVGGLCRSGAHRGFVLRYDEFQVVRERRGELTVSALLAAIAGAQQHGVPLMLVLCGLPPLVENLSRSKSYSERMFVAERLGNLRPPEDRAALADPAVRNGRRFDDDVIDAVIEDTGGYPFFLQLYGDTLWSGSTGAAITMRDFRRLRPGILEALDAGFFEARYQRAGPVERRILHAIADQGREEATTEQVQMRTGWTNSELQPRLSALLAKGLVYRPARGRIAFTAPMFGAFVRRRGADSNGQ
ncbi:MAG TPA: AAA family ATPase [Candidatus Dormibacteraeota bacterium]